MSTIVIRNPPSASDWERTAANAQHIENFVNDSTPAILTTPGGGTRNNLARWDSTIRTRYGVLNSRGAWVTATAYAVNDLYTSGGNTYIVLTAHTSAASVATDLAAGRVGIYRGALLSDVEARLAIAQNLADLASKGEALRNLGLIDNNSPINILNTTTLTLAQLNRGVVLGASGAATNYTLGLPASAPIGALVKIRVDQAAPGLYVIQGTDVGIDGLPTRTLWQGEAVLLERIVGGWTKIGGISRPFRGYARRTTSQTFTAGAITRVSFDSAGGDSTTLNLWWDAARARVIPPRPGYWHIGFNAVMAASASITHVEFGIQQVINDVTAAAFNVTPPGAFVDQPNVAASGSRICCSISGHYSSNAVGGWHGVIRPSGANGSIESVPGILETNLLITEIPLW